MGHSVGQLGDIQTSGELHSTSCVLGPSGYHGRTVSGIRRFSSERALASPVPATATIRGMEANTLGGAMRETARGAVSPAVREGRVSSLGPPVTVASRSLLGDSRPVPVRGGDAYPDLARGDAVWLAQDEGGGLVIVAWEAQ